ncbi:GNAT family N-acetyltransferase [Achromobacter sp. GG226]|uniref:bifunctional acetate--CoA ligase family protein/GNAT family N-acetyltransferase n=1 Tax=Verticiella alkaliphila TaxID=2779529 RepID=UPI001C0DB4A3|nr:GNAT family N-acetyltransferase [Verticiella sp. GG226]MBU4611710.1 GNAT family N-acetyltransferase [Verticiella sp. GG226]
MLRHALSPLFDPKSVILVSRYPLPLSTSLPERLAAFTTEAVFSAAGGMSLPALNGVAPGDRPDLAIVWVAPDELEQALRLLSTVAPRAAIVHGRTQGQLQSTLCEKWANEHDCVLIGPHSLGMQRPHAGLNASLHPTLAKAGRVALVAQSRAIMAAVMDWADDSRTAFSLAVSLDEGDRANLPRLLDFLASDPHTDSIALYVEHIGEARAFMSALRAAASAKPVVVLRPGRAQPGPPGAPLPPDTVFDTALRRAGALRVQFFVQLFSTIKALNQFSRPRGRRVAFFANGEGQVRLAQDLMVLQHAIGGATLAPDTRALLTQSLSPDAQTANPVIERAPLTPESVAGALKHLLGDPNVDGVLVLLTPDVRSDLPGIVDALCTLVGQARKPVVTCLMGDASMRGLRDRMARAGVPAFRTPETATDAFGQIARFHYNQQLLLQTQPPEGLAAPVDVAAAEAVIDATRADGRCLLDAEATSRVLASVGLTVHADEPLPEGAALARLRIVRDAVFGPVLSVSTADAWPSASSAGLELVPLNGFLAQRLMERSPLASVGLLQQLAPVAQNALEDVLIAFSELAVALPDLAEATLEPVWLDETRIRIHGAQLRLTAQPAARRAGHPHLAIAPYPTRWVRPQRFDDGTDWTLRPIRPEDAEPLQAFVRELSEQSRYMRFVSALRELPPRMLARYTQIDYDREVAFVATVQQPNPLHRGHPQEIVIGLAHYLRNADGVGAEYALAIADDWQRRRLGPALMRALIQAAREQGLAYLEGSVLATNRPMIKLMTSLGFRNERYPDDPSMRRIWLDLSAEPASSAPLRG